MPRPLDFFASSPRGLEDVLADELRALGARGVRPARAGAAFAGPLSMGLRACLWSRVASRVLLKIATVPASTADELYAAVRALPWEAHLAVDGTLAVSVVGTSPTLRHTGFTAQRTKDAIVDRFRELYGSRPSVDPAAPDVRVSVRLLGTSAIVSIDLSGEALHRRGYREPGSQVEAPMKENLAAGVLAVAGWRGIAADGGAFVDPLCGSATLGIEAAWIATDTAPGILREKWGFSGWLGRDDATWTALRTEAQRRSEAGRRSGVPPIACSDGDERAIELARSFVGRAGLDQVVSVERRDLATLSAPKNASFGLVATNPPYGGRLGQRDSLRQLYMWLRERLESGFAGWTLAVISGDPRIGEGLGLTPTRIADTFNGQIPVTVSVFEVPGAKRAPALGRDREPERLRVATFHAQLFENRLRKMSRHFGRWAGKSGVTCYRVYDADLPDYAVAIDVYGGAGQDEGRRWVHVSEYAPPPEIDPARASARLDDVVRVVPELLEVAPADVFVKERRRQRGKDQYQRLGRSGAVGVVEEDGLLFEVNFSDYLDTGLFLDHRVTRHMIREMARGKHFLNLFAYTGTASVYAAAGNAASTTSIDLSSTYLEWATRNMALNGLAAPEHIRVRADVLDWLSAHAALPQRYEIIFLDPPTFSTSKRMDGTLDVQRDHADLIVAASALLAEGGTIVFSSNKRRFRMDVDALESAGLAARDVTARTIPKDFEGRSRSHSCWFVASLA